MKKFKCLNHGTIAKVEGNKINITMNFNSIGCILSSMKEPQEIKKGKCNVVEVTGNE